MADDVGRGAFPDISNATLNSDVDDNVETKRRDIVLKAALYRDVTSLLSVIVSCCWFMPPHLQRRRTTVTRRSAQRSRCNHASRRDKTYDIIYVYFCYGVTARCGARWITNADTRRQTANCVELTR